MAPIPNQPDLHRSEQDSSFSVALVPDLIRLLDVCMIVLAACGCYAYFIRYNAHTIDLYVFATIFVAGCSLVLFARANLYSIHSIMRPVAISDYVIIGIVTSFLFFLTICFSFKTTELYSRFWLGSFCVTSICTVIGARLVVYRILKRLSNRKLMSRSMVILGDGSQAQQFLERFRNVNPHFLKIVGVFSTNEERKGAPFCGFNILGDVEALVEMARTRKIDDVVLALPWNADQEVKTAIEQLNELPVNVYISTDLVGFQLSFRPAMGAVNTLPLFEVVQRPISGWSVFVKSAEDLVLGTVFLILLLPVFLIVALAVRLDSPGPIFFKQERFGFNNERFSIYKFRSMYHREIPESRVKQAEKDDPRITPVGRFIRRTSIDELPQLLNVLNGTMSIVGPRPHAISHNEEYSKEIRGYYGRHRVKPGITGWAQVNGLRGETQDMSLMEARVQHDIYYADNWSLIFDLRIILMTLLVVFSQKNAY